MRPTGRIGSTSSPRRTSAPRALSLCVLRLGCGQSPARNDDVQAISTIASEDSLALVGVSTLVVDDGISGSASVR